MFPQVLSNTCSRDPVVHGGNLITKSLGHKVTGHAAWVRACLSARHSHVVRLHRMQRFLHRSGYSTDGSVRTGFRQVHWPARVLFFTLGNSAIRVTLFVILGEE